VQSRESLLWYFLSPLAWVLQGVAFPPLFSLAGSLGKSGFDARCPVVYSDLFPEFPGDSELIPVEARSTEKICVLWCSGCATGFTYTPDCEWIMVVYPGMKS